MSSGHAKRKSPAPASVGTAEVEEIIEQIRQGHNGTRKPYELTAAEIAIRTGVSLPTIRSRLMTGPWVAAPRRKVTVKVEHGRCRPTYVFDIRGLS